MLFDEDVLNSMAGGEVQYDVRVKRDTLQPDSPVEFT